MKKLEGQGYHVIRFSNEQVLFDTEMVMERVKNEIRKSPLNREDLGGSLI